ncbi:MAG: penicillin-binding protein activator, partial [Gemmatimonadota bacterium]|nr:penicillin-binding protein activator [Gemmatimonadota bacterium]
RVRWSYVVCVAMTVAAGCTLGTASRPESAAVPAADLDEAVAALQEAESAYDAGRLEEAARRADSLFTAWDGRRSLGALADRALWLSGRAAEARGLLGDATDRFGRLIDRLEEGNRRDEAIRRYVQLLGDTGREPEAVSAALTWPGVLDANALDALRQWVGGLSIDRLRGFAARHPPETAEARIVHVALAQLLFAGGQGGEARRVAEEVLRQAPPGPERDAAEILAAAGDAAGGHRAVLGAILPLTGELSNVGELLREGMELAVAGYERDRPDGFDVRIAFKDDRSDPERTESLVRELEAEGAIAILGPLRSESFAAAARARRNPRIPVLSPTATEVFAPTSAAYTLYDRSTREVDVAVELASWTVNELGLRRIGILEPADPAAARAVSAFRRAAAAAGGRIVAHATYDPGLTTFQAPIEEVAAAMPDAVYAPAPTPSVVLSFAPQLGYFGLDRSIVLGSEAWADPVVLRRIEPFAADHRVVGLWLDRMSPDTRWQRFVTEYERAYRKSLRDNVLPALAYDAVALVIAALEGSGVPIAAALSAYLERGPRIEGVTGTLRPDPESSTVRRETLIRMIVDGSLVPADRSELLNWLAEARVAPPLIQRDTVPR